MSHEDVTRYLDIIDLPHFVSKNRKHMSNLERAAQFAPFAALTGYDDSIKEEARLTDSRIELNAEQENRLNQKFSLLEKYQNDHPQIRITWFSPDERKKGGRYKEKDLILHQIDSANRLLIAADHTSYPMDDILDVEGEVFDFLMSADPDWY